MLMVLLSKKITFKHNINEIEVEKTLHNKYFMLPEPRALSIFKKKQRH